MTTNRPSNQEITASLKIYGVSATQDLCDQIRVYIDLLLRWNQKISLTTMTNAAEIIQFHFGESLFAASAIPIQDGRLADVGSGAGFPGLAIHLLVKPLEVVLIESNAKKAAFLSEVSRELGLKGVEVFRGRMKDFDSGDREIDLITARALGQHEELLEWSHYKLDHAGKLIMWLGEEDANSISRNTQWTWHELIKIPQSQRRFLLVGCPVR
jgi:16S rRNA (guanine527-N7)-methyltransferase